MPEMPPGFTSCKIKKNKIKYKKNQRKNVHYTDIEIVYFFFISACYPWTSQIDVNQGPLNWLGH
jgi:hypothetical protein